MESLPTLIYLKVGSSTHIEQEDHECMTTSNEAFSRVIIDFKVAKQGWKTQDKKGRVKSDGAGDNDQGRTPEGKKG